LVTFGVTNTVTIGALQIDVDYTNAQGDFEGTGDQVICIDLTQSLPAFNDNDATRTLSAGFISIAGFSGPRDVARCNFNTPDGDITDPVAGDFAITVVDATDPALNTVTVNMAVNNIVCTQVGGGTTTTTGTPTTTSGGTTTTTTGGGGTAFDIAFSLVEAVNVGALQYNVDYSAAGGGFDGAGDTVQCTDSTGSLPAYNDAEGTTTLSVGLINLGGFTGPRLVTTCSFTSTGGTPTAGDFVVTVEDAATPTLVPIVPLPTISVAVTPG
jgi:hypothetical protein